MRAEELHAMFVDFFADCAGRSPAELATAMLRRFSAAVVKFPSMPDVERVVRGRAIVESLNRDPSTVNVRRLEDLHGVPKRAVAKIFSKATGEGLRDVRARREQEQEQ